MSFLRNRTFPSRRALPRTSWPQCGRCVAGPQARPPFTDSGAPGPPMRTVSPRLAAYGRAMGERHPRLLVLRRTSTRSRGPACSGHRPLRQDQHLFGPLRHLFGRHYRYPRCRRARRASPMATLTERGWAEQATGRRRPGPPCRGRGCGTAATCPPLRSTCSMTPPRGRCTCPRAHPRGGACSTSIVSTTGRRRAEAS